jgi:CheY-like chemotaxis protein
MPTILLVDDDPLQAYLMMSLLGRRFSDVRRVNDPAEALCLVEQRDFTSNLGLVISGHHTLGFGGPAFVAELRARIPALPILVLGMTGESASDYTGSRVVFVPRDLVAEQMVTLSSQLLDQPKREFA